MIKILLVANTDWYLYRFRISLARYLRAQGWNVVFVSPDGQYAQFFLAEGFRWLEWRIGRQTINPFEEIKAVFDLVRIFRYERPALVHLHTVKPVLYGSLAARLVRTPAIVRSITGRGYVFLGNDLRARLLRPLVKLIYRFALRSPSGVTIFENDADRKYFLEAGLASPQSSFLIEGVGVDTDYYFPLPDPEGTPTVLMASRLLWDKGVGTFVEAARLLKQKTNIRCVLVGETDPGNPASIKSATLNEWIEQGLIEWWGWQRDMRAVFAACHVVTLPSLGEGIPTVLLEAAACGRPIVATDVPGCRDVVQHGVNGLLVPPKDPQALAEAVLRLLNDPALRSIMGAEGRRLVVQRFSEHHIHAQTLALYSKVLSDLTK